MAMFLCSKLCNTHSSHKLLITTKHTHAYMHAHTHTQRVIMYILYKLCTSLTVLYNVLEELVSVTISCTASLILSLCSGLVIHNSCAISESDMFCEQERTENVYLKYANTHSYIIIYTHTWHVRACMRVCHMSQKGTHIASTILTAIIAPLLIDALQAETYLLGRPTHTYKCT